MRPGPRAPLIAIALAALLSACASGPPVPDWQLQARSSLDRATAAWLDGNARVAEVEYALARQAAAATGRAEVVARIELARCAARVAVLQFEPCTGYEALRADAGEAAAAYADHLAGTALPRERQALLPAAQQPVAARLAADLASSPADAAAGLPAGLDEPLSRLVAAAVLLRAGRASPAVIEQAVDTASQQGWRRPLLAWLGLQRDRARAAGDTTAVARVERRMVLVTGERPEGRSPR